MYLKYILDTASFSIDTFYICKKNIRDKMCHRSRIRINIIRFEKGL